jgi:SHS2 domain-containing protein
MVEKYRFLRHTADAKFQAFGTTLEEAFINAALATASLMWDLEKIEKKMDHRIEVKGKDLKQLLMGFLEEIIYLLDSKMFLLSSPENLRIEKKGSLYVLKAILKGDKYSEKYEIHGDVKAITYNEMEIEKDARFMVQVVVDV